jgi:hypothetical protein
MFFRFLAFPPFEDEEDGGGSPVDSNRRLRSIRLTPRFSGRETGISRIYSLDVGKYERAVP